MVVVPILGLCLLCMNDHNVWNMRLIHSLYWCTTQFIVIFIFLVIFIAILNLLSKDFRYGNLSVRVYECPFHSLCPSSPEPDYVSHSRLNDGTPLYSGQNGLVDEKVLFGPWDQKYTLDKTLRPSFNFLFFLVCGTFGLFCHHPIKQDDRWSNIGEEIFGS